MVSQKECAQCPCAHAGEQKIKSMRAQISIVVAVLLSGWGVAFAADSEGVFYFEKNIRPVLVKHCYKCHSAEAKKLKAGLRRKFAGRKPAINLQQALQADDFFAFDDAATAPLNGFENARDYYARCSSRPFLQAIRRPTLIIHAADDPFMTPTVVPKAEELAPGVRLELAAHGGHVGFVSADRWGQPQLWLERRLPAYARELASNTGLHNDP